MVRTDFGREWFWIFRLPSGVRFPNVPGFQVFDWDSWQDGFDEYWIGDKNKSIRDEFRAFQTSGSGKFQELPRASHYPRSIYFEGSRMRCL